MSYDLLIARIDEGLRAKRLSERRACMLADVGLKTISHIRKRGHAPKIANLEKLAPVLGYPADYLIEAAKQGSPAEPDGLPAMEKVFVKGVVQAGAWRSEVVWPEQDWYSMDVARDPRYPGIPRFGLLVRGSSMDRLYPEGTIVYAIRFFELGRGPREGEKVICLRRGAGGEYEATLKEYQRDAQGRHILWPRSSDPEFQAPIILPPSASMGAEDLVDLPQIAFAYSAPDAGVEDLIIDALVVGSYKLE